MHFPLEEAPATTVCQQSLDYRFFDDCWIYAMPCQFIHARRRLYVSGGFCKQINLFCDNENLIEISVITNQYLTNWCMSIVLAIG